MSRTYQCCECGRITSQFNEGQCTHCLANDTLIPTNAYTCDEELQVFDIIAEGYDPDEKW